MVRLRSPLRSTMMLNCFTFCFKINGNENNTGPLLPTLVTHKNKNSHRKDILILIKILQIDLSFK